MLRGPWGFDSRGSRLEVSDLQYMRGANGCNCTWFLATYEPIEVMKRALKTPANGSHMQRMPTFLKPEV